MLIGHHRQFAFASQGNLDANAKVVSVSKAASDIERAWTLLSCLLVFHSFLIQHFLDVYWAQSDDLLAQPPDFEGWLYAAIFAGFMVVVVLCVREPRLRVVFQGHGITFLKGRFLWINCDAKRIVGLRIHRVTSLDNTATLEIENRDGGKWKYYGFE